MGLRQEIRRHAHLILTDVKHGFAWPLVVTDPDGTSARLSGFSTDIADLIDPETGMGVSGRQAEVTISMQSLKCVGMEHPTYIASGEGKPWTIKFDDSEGSPWTFKVMRAAPDRMTGVVLCYLEAYVA